MNTIIYSQWCTQHFDESLCLLAGPSMLHLSILTELRLEQVVVAVNAHSLESQGAELEDSRTIDIALLRGEHSLDIRHDGLEILTLMKEHSIPVGHLVFPVLLPFAECRFL